MNKSKNYPLSIIEEYLDKTHFKLNRRSLYILNYTGSNLKENSLLKDKIEEKGYLLSILENPQIQQSFLSVVEYYLPFLQNSAVIHSDSSIKSKIFGDISENNTASVTYLYYSDLHSLNVSTIKSTKELLELITQLPKYSEISLFEGTELFSPHISYEDPVPLTEETQKIINEITYKLRILNNTGEFLTVLPIIEKQLQNYKSRANFPVSNLNIDEQYRIYLTDYNNKEVKLSHLSKSIYFLFLMKEQIHLNEFSDYKAELLTIYKHVSNQENLEKMANTIDNLVLNENKELYVHFSRIKSAFCSLIADDFAKNYYIRGDKGKPKKIILDLSKSNISELRSEFFPNEENLLFIRKYFDGIFL